MATPDELKKQKELNDLLEQENLILKRKLELQSESYDLSSTILEELKETLGIRTRLTTYEKGIYDLNKKINRTIRDQKIEFDNIKGIQKQIQNNADLINKAKLFEKGLQSSLSKQQKEKVKDYLKETQVLSDIDKQINKELSKAQEGKKINTSKLKLLELERDIITENIEAQSKLLGYTAQQYVWTKLNTKELEKQNRERKKEAENLKNIDKKLGVTSGILKGLSKTRFVKDLGIDFDEALEKARKTTSTTGNGVTGLKVGLKSVGSQLKSSLTNPANATLFIFTQMIDALQKADKATGDLAKSFNITYEEASLIREDLISMGNSSGDISVNAIKLQESMIAVGKSLGSNAVLNQKDLVTFTQMREKAELTNEELVEMQKLTYVSGINLEENVGSLLAAAKMTGLRNKMLLNEKDIMRDVSKTSKAIELSLGGQGKSLGEAAAQVKILGMNMKQVEDIAGSLLDFESSISAELEAELLTGKDLNLERARLYAINNDMYGVAKEIRKNYGDTAEFAKLNRIQQEAAAKAVGMSREDLAATLTDEKALRGLNEEEKNAAQAALEYARARGMTEAEIGKKSIEDLKNQQSIQERLNNTVEKLQEIFISIAQPLLPVLDILASVFDVVGQIMAVLDPFLQGISGIFAVLGDLLDSKTYKTGEWKRYNKAESRYNESVQKNWIEPIGDMEYDNKTGKTLISPKEGGLFAPSQNDYISVGPKDSLKPLKPNTLNPLLILEHVMEQGKQINQLIAIQTAQANRPINVSAKVNDRELLHITADRANEESNLKRRTAYRLQ